jgi:hypothetical protein
MCLRILIRKIGRRIYTVLYVLINVSSTTEPLLHMRE